MAYFAFGAVAIFKAFHAHSPVRLGITTERVGCTGTIGATLATGIVLITRFAGAGHTVVVISARSVVANTPGNIWSSS